MTRRSPLPVCCRAGGTSPDSAVVHAFDVRAECAKPLVNSLVAALDLADVVNPALALRAERGEQHGHAGANVGRFHATAVQFRGADDDGTMRIAEYDARAHADQL